MFLNKTFIGDCPLFLNKTVYRRLSNAVEIKAGYWRMSTVFE